MVLQSLDLTLSAVWNVSSEHETRQHLAQPCLETLRAPASIENELFVGLRPGQRPDEIDSLPARQAGT